MSKTRKPKPPQAVIRREGNTVQLTNLLGAVDIDGLAGLDGYAGAENKGGGCVITFASAEQAKAGFEVIFADSVSNLDEVLPNDHIFDDVDGGMSALAEATVAEEEAKPKRRRAGGSRAGKRR